MNQVERAVWAEGVIDLLWSDYSMLADGARLDYADVVARSRDDPIDP